MARDLGHEGIDAYERGDYDTALDKLNRAYGILPMTTLGLWSARAMVARGSLVEASERYSAVLRTELAPDAAEALVQAKQDAALEKEALEERIPALTITVQGAAENAVVTLDGAPLKAALLGVPYSVNPGDHEIRAEISGAIAEQRVHVKEAEHQNVVLRFSPPEPRGATHARDAAPGASMPVGNTASSSSGGLQRTLGWVALGVGAAGVATGAIGTVVAVGKKSELEAAGCDEELRCPTRLANDVDSYNDLRTISTVGWVVAAAGVGAGLTLLFTAPSAESDASTALILGVGNVTVAGSF